MTAVLAGARAGCRLPFVRVRRFAFLLEERACLQRTTGVAAGAFPKKKNASRLAASGRSRSPKPHPRLSPPTAAAAAGAAAAAASAASGPVCLRSNPFRPRLNIKNKRSAPSKSRKCIHFFCQVAVTGIASPPVSTRPRASTRSNSRTEAPRTTRKRPSSSAQSPCASRLCTIYNACNASFRRPSGPPEPCSGARVRGGPPAAFLSASAPHLKAASVATACPAPEAGPAPCAREK